MFAQEAIRCLKLEDTRPSLPVTQGMALMYVYEGALGDGESALEFHTLMQQRYKALRLDDIQPKRLIPLQARDNVLRPMLCLGSNGDSMFGTGKSYLTEGFTQPDI